MDLATKLVLLGALAEIVRTQQDVLPVDAFSAAVRKVPGFAGSVADPALWGFDWYQLTAFITVARERKKASVGELVYLSAPLATAAQQAAQQARRASELVALAKDDLNRRALLFELSIMARHLQSASGDALFRAVVTNVFKMPDSMADPLFWGLDWPSVRAFVQLATSNQSATWEQLYWLTAATMSSAGIVKFDRTTTSTQTPNDPDTANLLFAPISGVPTDYAGDLLPQFARIYDSETRLNVILKLIDVSRWSLGTWPWDIFRLALSDLLELPDYLVVLSYWGLDWNSLGTLVWVAQDFPSAGLGDVMRITRGEMEFNALPHTEPRLGALRLLGIGDDKSGGDGGDGGDGVNVTVEGKVDLENPIVLLEGVVGGALSDLLGGGDAPPPPPPPPAPTPNLRKKHPDPKGLVWDATTGYFIDKDGFAWSMDRYGNWVYEGSAVSVQAPPLSQHPPSEVWVVGEKGWPSLMMGAPGSQQGSAFPKSDQPCPLNGRSWHFEEPYAFGIYETEKDAIVPAVIPVSFRSLVDVGVNESSEECLVTVDQQLSFSGSEQPSLVNAGFNLYVAGSVYSSGILVPYPVLEDVQRYRTIGKGSAPLPVGTTSFEVELFLNGWYRATDIGQAQVKNVTQDMSCS